MKHTTYFIVFLFCLQGFAQPTEKREKLTLSQRAQLESKKMQLHLDLTEEKISVISDILFSHYSELRSLRKNTTKKNRFEKRLTFLELQIELKKEMKTLLSEKAFEEWEKTHMKRQRKIAKATKNEAPRMRRY